MQQGWANKPGGKQGQAGLKQTPGSGSSLAEEGGTAEPAAAAGISTRSDELRNTVSDLRPESAFASHSQTGFGEESECSLFLFLILGLVPVCFA